MRSRYSWIWGFVYLHREGSLGHSPFLREPELRCLQLVRSHREGKIPPSQMGEAAMTPAAYSGLKLEKVTQQKSNPKNHYMSGQFQIHTISMKKFLTEKSTQKLTQNECNSWTLRKDKASTAQQGYFHNSENPGYHGNQFQVKINSQVKKSWKEVNYWDGE